MLGLGFLLLGFFLLFLFSPCKELHFCRTVFLYKSILLKALLPSSPSKSYCYKSAIKDVFSRVWHTNSTQSGTAKPHNFIMSFQIFGERKDALAGSISREKLQLLGREHLRFHSGAKEQKDKCLNIILEKNSQTEAQTWSRFSRTEDQAEGSFDGSSLDFIQLQDFAASHWWLWIIFAGRTTLWTSALEAPSEQMPGRAASLFMRRSTTRGQSHESCTAGHEDFGARLNRDAWFA